MHLDNLRDENPFAPCQVRRGGRFDLLTLMGCDPERGSLTTIVLLPQL